MRHEQAAPSAANADCRHGITIELDGVSAQGACLIGGDRATDAPGGTAAGLRGGEPDKVSHGGPLGATRSTVDTTDALQPVPQGEPVPDAAEVLRQRVG